MPEYTLTVLDTVGVQGYVFGSNVLRENIGASELVYRATRQWAFEETRAGGKTNVKDDYVGGEPEDLVTELHIEDGQIQAEVIYAGGGNCAILFTDPDAAKGFVERLSGRVLSGAPDLDLVVTHVPMDWEGDALADKVKQAFSQLAMKKLNRPVSTPVLGQGVTMACRSTGLPAVGIDQYDRPLAAPILAKLEWPRRANKRLSNRLAAFGDAKLTVPYDFDHFGRERGEISYIAVVHADGNGMGKRLERLRADFGQPTQNRAYIEAMRDFSGQVETAARQALEALSGLLVRRINGAGDAIEGRVLNEKGESVTVGAPIKLAETPEGQHYVPFRPVVFGGDDLTFVTDGRLGLPLAAAYLDAFERAVAEQTSPYLQGLQACAGVAVVKAHYPFSRAYELAEDLCRNAKALWERKCSALDWHFAGTGLFGDIESIRRRQYTEPAGHLELRPVSLLPQAGSWRSWPALIRVAKDLLTKDPWAKTRSKVIGLREPLREGPQAVEQYRRAFKLPPLPTLASGIDALQTTGWDGAGRCGYFDVVEALDFLLLLED